MQLAERFSAVTFNKTVKIIELQQQKPYCIKNAARITTKFGRR
jgi:hypothetical protein